MKIFTGYVCNIQNSGSQKQNHKVRPKSRRDKQRRIYNNLPFEEEGLMIEAKEPFGPEFLEGEGFN
jgi:hypothetical protein